MDYSVGTPGKLNKYTTGYSGYADKPVRNLSKDDLKKVIKIYKSKLGKMSAKYPEDKYVKSGGEAFLNKADALLKNKKTKFIRLEYE